MRLMEGEHIGPFNLGNPGEFTMLELAEVSVQGTWAVFVLDRGSQIVIAAMCDDDEAADTV